MLQLTKKDLKLYIERRMETITSPVAYSYGYESKESAYEKLLELHTLSVNFGIGMEERLEKAMEPYSEFFKKQYEQSKKMYHRKNC